MRSATGSPRSFSGWTSSRPRSWLAGVDGDDRDDRLAVHRLGQERRGRRGGQVDERRQLVGQLAHPVAVEAQHLLGAVAREEDRAGQHHRADRVQPELERRRDAEVAAAAAQAPEQLGVLVLAGVHELAVGGDDVGADQVVAGQADLAHEPADAAAEREPGDARWSTRARRSPRARRPGSRGRSPPTCSRPRRRPCAAPGRRARRSSADRSMTTPPSHGREAGDASGRRRGRRRAGPRCARSRPRA